MKCCTKLETAKERCPIVFQGHPSNFKVTRDKTSPILTQIGRFRTIGRSQLSNPPDLPCSCMKTWHRSGFDVKSWFAIPVVIVKFSFFAREFVKLPLSIVKSWCWHYIFGDLFSRPLPWNIWYWIVKSWHYGVKTWNAQYISRDNVQWAPLLSPRSCPVSWICGIQDFWNTRFSTQTTWMRSLVLIWYRYIWNEISHCTHLPFATNLRRN